MKTAVGADHCLLQEAPTGMSRYGLQDRMTVPGFVVAGALCCCLLTAHAAAADTIHFKNGTRLDVPSAWEENGEVRCELYGRVVGYPLADVLRVDRQQNIGKDQSDQTGIGLTKVETLHRKARDFADRGRWADAVATEKKALTLDPGNEIVKKSLAGFYYRQALDLRQRGMLQQALAHLYDALEHDPHRQQIQSGIASIYCIQARSACDTSDFRTCRRLAQRAAEFDKENPDVYVLLGDIAYASDKNDKAHSLWTKALAINGRLPGVRQKLHKLEQERAVESGFDLRETGNFKVKFEAGDDHEAAGQVLAILENAYRDICRAFDIFPDDAITVILYPQSNLSELTYYPDWAAGLYDGKIRIGTDLLNDDLHTKAVLYHEFTHAVVFRIAGPRVPLWLNEGLAEHEASRFMKPAWRRYRSRLLKKALRQKKLIPFSHIALMNTFGLSGLPPVMIDLVYAQSESFVTFIIENNSMYDIRSILADIAKGTGFNTAFENNLGYPLPALEKTWKEQLLKQ